MKFSLSLAILGAASVAQTAHLQIFIAPSTLVPSPSTQIPVSTSAYLTRAGQVYAAPLSSDGLFDFRNVTAGSYLVDIVSLEYLFAPLRVDVLDNTDAQGSGSQVSSEEVKAWGTWRGNEWSNTAEPYDVMSESGVRKIKVEVRGKKEIFYERVGFSVMSILKNPMILMAGAACLMMFGMPYLIDNMDDETRAEFEERQKTGPMAQIMGQAGGKQAAPDFDPAGWLAEKTAGGKKGKSS